jgi:hypothetical protein
MQPKAFKIHKCAGFFIMLAAFVVMIAMNAYLATKVGKLARDVQRLNLAYGEAIESLRGVRELVDSLPDVRFRYEESPDEDF